MIYLYAWLLVGFGVWLGLVTPEANNYRKDGFQIIFLAFILTVPIWPIAIYANWNSESLMSNDAS